jgi:uncharacterized protein (DUF1800 family)
MKAQAVPGRLVYFAGLLSALTTSQLIAGDANPPPPSVTTVAVLSNSQHKVSWTPYPAADAYSIISTPDVTQPFALDPSGSVLGYDWTAPLSLPANFYKVQVTPMSSNALFSATVLNRLAYGPTPDDIERIATIGAQAYIDEQTASELISESIDTDAPITNAPPPAPPLTNWIRVSATGTVSSGTNFLIFLSGAGRVYLDDIRLVSGTSADTGPNLLLNGDFEDPSLSPSWNVGFYYPNSLITSSPTVDGSAASGTNCLLLVASGGGGNQATNRFWQPFATNIPAASEQFTLSFSYLPVQQATTNPITLTVVLSGATARRDVILPTAPLMPPPAPPSVSPVYAKLTNTVATINDLRAWQVYHAIHSKRQLHEVLAQFFQNHFTTQYQKTKDWFDNNYMNAITNGTIRQYLAVDLHWREHKKFRDLLIDPNCTFYDLLKVSIESPAMVIYLDTVLNSKNAPNQNYAREILELHTMGADNGYIQQDIVDLAKVWTGWRVVKKDSSVAGNPFAPAVTDPTNMPGLFVLHYATNSHDLGTKRLFTNSVIEPRFGSFRGGQPYSLILSNTMASGTNGFGEGYKVIEHLANLPYTMEFVSVKLCRTFVHEDFDFGIYDYTAPSLSPEVQLIKDCMTAWETPATDGRKGNIRSVVSAIFNSALFRGHGASRQKVKTPLELAVSAVRALRVTSTDTNGYLTSTADSDGYGISGTGGADDSISPLSRMGGMRLFNKAEPDGYSEFGSIWLNTANLCERMRYTQQFLEPGTSSLKGSAVNYDTPGRANTSDPVKLLQLKLPSTSWYDAAAVVDYFLSILYPGEGKANLDLDRQAAIDFLNSSDSGVPGSSLFSSLAGDATAYDGRVRSMVGMLMSLPRFQEQ